MTPQKETYYCTHCEPDSDNLVPQYFNLSIGSTRRLILCEQCYRTFAHLVIADLVQEAGKAIGKELGRSSFWMDGRFIGTKG